MTPAPARNGSPAMQRLRILSGQHAGATLDLTPGTHSIGPDHDCDISITDWTFPPLRLAVGHGGEVLASWGGERDAARRAGAATALPAGGVDPAARSQQFTDFEPCAFGDIVLCVGPVDKPWPADRQLLEAAFPPTAQRVAHWAGARLRARATTVIAGLSVLTVVAIGSISLVGTPRAARPVETIDSVVTKARQAVARAGAATLQVQAAQSTIVVSGLVETPEQRATVRAAVEALRGRFAVNHQFGVASEVAESIRSSVGLPGAEVKHLGDGVFSFTAESADAQATRQAIERVVADLGPLVRRVDTTLEQTEKKGAEPPILSSMRDDDVSVVQTRDGQKHLVLTPPETGVTVRRALSIP